LPTELVKHLLLSPEIYHTPENIPDDSILLLHYLILRRMLCCGRDILAAASKSH